MREINIMSGLVANETKKNIKLKFNEIVDYLDLVI